MGKIIYRAASRGKFQNDWLNTSYSFSFADYFDRNRLNFGALRVLNDDIIQPSQGFGKHPHDNMEIITIPLSGKLTHQDSMGHSQEIGVNEVQVMSAGTGIFHSEFNADPENEVSLLQIWIYPHTKSVKPSYDQKVFNPDEANGKWQELVSGYQANLNSLFIHQHAKISRIFLAKGKGIEYQPNIASYGSFAFVVEGKIEIDNDQMGKRDAVGLINAENIAIKALEDSFVLMIEVPEK